MGKGKEGEGAEGEEEEGDEGDQIDKAQDPMDNLGETVVETIYNNNATTANQENENQDAEVEYNNPMTMNEYINSYNQSGGVVMTASGQGALDMSAIPNMPSINGNNQYIQQGSYIVSDNNGNNFSQYYQQGAVAGTDDLTNFNAQSYVMPAGTDNFNQYYQNTDGTSNIDLNNLGTQGQQVYDLNNFGQNVTSTTDYNQYNMGIVSQTGDAYYNTYGGTQVASTNIEGTFASPTQTYGMNLS